MTTTTTKPIVTVDNDVGKVSKAPNKMVRRCQVRITNGMRVDVCLFEDGHVIFGLRSEQDTELSCHMHDVDLDAIAEACAAARAPLAVVDVTGGKRTPVPAHARARAESPRAAHDFDPGESGRIHGTK